MKPRRTSLVAPRALTVDPDLITPGANSLASIGGIRAATDIETSAGAAD